jgi:hypothetical protein
MKKSYLLIAILVILLVGGLYGIKRGKLANNPSLPSSLPTPTKISCTALTLNSPTSNQKVTSPLSVTVTVDNTNKNCRWTVFEAQAGTIEVIDENKTIIGQGVLTTEDDWMTDQPVTYKGSITFTKEPSGKVLHLQIREEDPSGKLDPQILTFPLTY